MHLNQFTKRLIFFGVAVIGFASFTFALSQAVSYKPWGVPDSRRDDYDRLVAELDDQAELRDTYAARAKPMARAWPSQHDFGWVRPGEVLRQVFRIENAGDQELQVKVRNTSSDRVTAELTNELLAPGEVAQCTVEMTAAAEPMTRPARETVTLTTNDPFNRTLTLAVQSQQRKELVFPSQIGFESHDIGRAAMAECLVYSQLGHDLKILDVSCDNFDVEWVAVPEQSAIEQLEGKSATVAKRLTIEIESNDYGSYTGVFDLALELDGVAKQVQIEFGGRVRPPIGFYGPIVDRRTGIDFGTVDSREQHDLYVVVRSRADRSRKIAVLDVEPKELQAELEPLETEGSYRLRISIPKDCPYRRFNLAEQHGYVQIGDPEMKSYSNWLPVYGVVGRFESE
ncbi:hypothetical protein Enr13x_71550 [Stieleria neptunia]|uniref:Uncharacterized protein n=1 Tax=Stieleria neptunia TaxID=2527979 RepID=A0A518I2G6_9BACT|nr:DUF1573 domain-containing protein [Stieleria neptunia]QDV47246.1 hypothetical protein Enr13x_71550 [Stieleria neptunia]